MHAIRLRGPWEFEPLADSSSSTLPASGTVHVLNDAAIPLPADFRGRVLLRRRFGLPTNLDARQRVWLVLDGIDPVAPIVLNGQSLVRDASNSPPSRIDITGHLGDRNELQVELAWPCSPPGDVRLEIDA